MFKALQPKRMIDRAKGKLTKCFPGYRDAQGQGQTSREAIAGAWQRQFAEVENAEPATMQELRQASKPFNKPRDVKILKEIPTLYDYEAALRGMSDGKAAGVDGIGAELLQLNIVPHAQRMYSLMLKSCSSERTNAR